MVNAILRDRSTQDFYLSYGSTAKIGFILHETDGVKGWRQSFAPAISPQVRDSDYSYQHQNPLVDVALGLERHAYFYPRSFLLSQRIRCVLLGVEDVQIWQTEVFQQLHLVLGEVRSTF